jgi:large subunit ribosomal protein L24
MATVAKRRAKAARKQRMQLVHEGWAGGHTRVLDIRAGDTVEVIAGKDRGKRGVVERVRNAEQRIVVRGVNVQKRHTRANARADQAQGGIIDFYGPIAYSNVMLVCNRCDKRTRISHETAGDGSRGIVCKQCGERYERTSS